MTLLPGLPDLLIFHVIEIIPAIMPLLQIQGSEIQLIIVNGERNAVRQSTQLNKMILNLNQNNKNRVQFNRHSFLH